MKTENLKVGDMIIGMTGQEYFVLGFYHHKPVISCEGVETIINNIEDFTLKPKEEIKWYQVTYLTKSAQRPSVSPALFKSEADFIAHLMGRYDFEWIDLKEYKRGVRDGFLA